MNLSCPRCHKSFNQIKDEEFQIESFTFSCSSCNLIIIYGDIVYPSQCFNDDRLISLARYLDYICIFRCYGYDEFCPRVPFFSISLTKDFCIDMFIYNSLQDFEDYNILENISKKSIEIMSQDNIDYFFGIYKSFIENRHLL